MIFMKMILIIALIAYKPTKMHYANIVAVDDDDIAILDTTDDLYYYKKNDSEDLLDCSSYLPHNTISFVLKPNNFKQ